MVGNERAYFKAFRNQFLVHSRLTDRKESQIGSMTKAHT